MNPGQNFWGARAPQSEASKMFFGGRHVPPMPPRTVYALTVLSHVQNFRSFHCCPAVQDAMSLLHAVLLFYKSGYCINDQ